MDHPAEVIQGASRDRVDKALQRAWEGVSRDRRDVPQEELDDDGTVYSRWDAPGVQRCVWTTCSQSGMEDPYDGYPGPVLEERMGERFFLPQCDLHESGGIRSGRSRTEVGGGTGMSDGYFLLRRLCSTDLSQTMGFQDIGGDRRFVRHIKFTTERGEVVEARLVYDYCEGVDVTKA